MASVSTLPFLKSRLYAKSRLFNVKFHFGHKISFLKSRLFVKLRFVKSRLYCTNNTFTIEGGVLCRGRCGHFGRRDLRGCSLRRWGPQQLPGLGDGANVLHSDSPHLRHGLFGHSLILELEKGQTTPDEPRAQKQESFSTSRIWVSQHHECFPFKWPSFQVKMLYTVDSAYNIHGYKGQPVIVAT